MQLSALQRPASLVEEVCSRLSDLILGQPDHDHDRATWLPPERSLAQQLGVSRTVVREATKRLEQQGLLEIQHGTGIKIIRQLHRPLSDSLALLIPDLPSRLRQLHQTRHAIEPAAAALAAQNASHDQLLATRAAHERLANATSNEEAIQADIEWHHLVAAASGNQIFSLILDSLADLGLESRLRTIGHIGKGPAVEHHALIQKALENRNPTAASAAMKSHLEAALRDLHLDESQP
jgi:GntR family transcriptional repressor for pyruvate dehydrogenase complex